MGVFKQGRHESNQTREIDWSSATNDLSHTFFFFHHRHFNAAIQARLTYSRHLPASLACVGPASRDCSPNLYPPARTRKRQPRRRLINHGGGASPISFPCDVIKTSPPTLHHRATPAARLASPAVYKYQPREAHSSVRSTLETEEGKNSFGVNNSSNNNNIKGNTFYQGLLYNAFWVNL